MKEQAVCSMWGKSSRKSMCKGPEVGMWEEASEAAGEKVREDGQRSKECVGRGAGAPARGGPGSGRLSTRQRTLGEWSIRPHTPWLPPSALTPALIFITRSWSGHSWYPPPGLTSPLSGGCGHPHLLGVWAADDPQLLPSLDKNQWELPRPEMHGRALSPQWSTAYT